MAGYTAAECSICRLLKAKGAILCSGEARTAMIVDGNSRDFLATRIAQGKSAVEPSTGTVVAIGNGTRPVPSDLQARGHVRLP